jgi:hypothetical protein
MALVGFCGCAARLPRFPAAPLATTPNTPETLTWDVSGDGQADYWTHRDANGRTRELDFDDPGGRVRVVLDDVAAADVPHYMIILDGVPFDTVQQLWAQGHFRLFYPPQRVISCFPVMTDLALTDLFHAPRCRGYEALYYDRARQRLSDGSAVYMRGENAPWTPQVQYRAALWWDLLVYLDPQTVFNHELHAMYGKLQKPGADAAVYSVGTAGLGTRGSAPAIEKYLQTVDRLCEQLVYERRGQVKLTVTADHGHNLVANRRIDFVPLLRKQGFRPVTRLTRPHDVVPICYGMVTYAAFYTHEPAELATALLTQPEIEFAAYREGPALIVRDAHGAAAIRQQGSGFTYEPDGAGSDPLKLGPILAGLRGRGAIAEDGTIDEDALFAATATHDYPDPLARLWRAFDGLVDNPADLIVNLRDGTCNGSAFFAGMIGQANSTHGSLNRLSSTTFVLTMLGELPTPLRSREVLPALERLRGRPGTVTARDTTAPSGTPTPGS